MSFDGIVVGDYGQILQITFIDVDTGSAADISAYTAAQQIIITDPDGNAATKTAAFANDGSDGTIKYTIEDGLFDEAGPWKARGRVSSGSAVLTTVEHSFRVVA